MSFETELKAALGAEDVTLCGSRATCNPPPVGTDTDYLVLVHDDVMPNVMTVLSKRGFHWEGGEHYREAARDGFMSWRKDDVNLIVTSNPEWAHKHHVASAVCKHLNLMRKIDRVVVFQAVLYSRTIA